jgi:hypothetical protein
MCSSLLTVIVNQIDPMILDQIKAALARNKEAASLAAVLLAALASVPVQAAAAAAPVPQEPARPAAAAVPVHAAAPVPLQPDPPTAASDTAPDLESLQSPAEVLRFLHDRIQQSRSDMLVMPSAVSMTQRLGGGGFGSVCSCVYHGTPHAVKRIAIEQLMISGMPAPVIARMALAEITAMLRLRHRRLVQLAALSFVAEGAPVLEHDAEAPQELEFHEIWMLMPLADGGSLRPAMGRLRGNPVLCMRLLSHVAEAVVFMHEQGSAHLDIKPDVVLKPSADLFAFGVTVLELLTGMSATKINFAATTGAIATVVTRLPAAAQSLGPLLAWCVNVNPAARPAMSDVYQALSAASGAPVAAASAAAAAR